MNNALRQSKVQSPIANIRNQVTKKVNNALRQSKVQSPRMWFEILNSFGVNNALRQSKVQSLGLLGDGQHKIET